MRKLIAISIVMLAVCTQGVAQEPPDLVAIRGAFAQAIDDHDVDAIVSHFADDGVHDATIFPAPLVSPEQMKAFWVDQFSGSPDWHTMDGRVLTVGNIVVVEHAAVGTNTGESAGLPVTGNPWTWPHLDLYEFEGEKIKRLMSYGDYASILIQLGLAPAPEPFELVPSFTLPDPEPTGLSPMEADVENMVRYNGEDIAHYAKMFRLDAQIFPSPLGMTVDRDAWIAMEEMNSGGFSDGSAEVVRRVDLGDGWILTEIILRSKHTGTYLGVPASGNMIELRCAYITHYDADGLITHKNIYWDNLTLMTQMTPQAPEWPPAPDYLIQDEIHSPSLEGNLLGDPATRPVLVYLPPSYETSPDRHYPTVYLLHGFDTNHLCFTSSGVDLAMKLLAGIDLGADVGSITAELMAAGQMDELIIVMPNAANSLAGSIYERSPLIGDYRDYIAKDLVTYIDGKYRTIANASARGIGGHSMGGYGALSLAMEYPDVFGAVAALSPALCDMENDSAIDDYVAKYPLVLGLPIPGYESEDMWNIFLGYFEVNWLYAVAAAWTPNLENPPFYVDLPVQYPGPTVVTDILEQWKDRDLVSQVDRDGANLSGKPIFVDEGRGPAMIMAEVTGVDRLLAALHAQGLSYTYDAFDGDHLTYFGYQIASGLEFLSDALHGEP